LDVSAVLGTNLLNRLSAKPKLERGRAPLDKLVQSIAGNHLRLLDDIGRVDASTQGRVHPQVDHTAEVVAMRLDQFTQRSTISKARRPKQRFGV
jgi:hypothetical protein